MEARVKGSGRTPWFQLANLSAMVREHSRSEE